MSTQPKDRPLSESELATNAITWEHIDVVMRLLASAQMELMRRQFTHDRTKLLPPEVECFTEYTPKLKASTYGSDEYKAMLAEMAPALKHHYSHNRHHPEYFESCSESPEIAEYLYMANWAAKHGEVLPDDRIRYKELVDYLAIKQAEAKSSINRMNLFDILEMFIDWNAAVLRHADGDINKSIEINTKRFAMSPQLVKIFENTIGWVRDEFSGLKSQSDLCQDKKE
jgi:hypothetical protein